MNKEDLQRIKDHDLWPKVMEHFRDAAFSMCEWVAEKGHTRVVHETVGSFAITHLSAAVEAALSDFDDESKGEASPSEMVAEMNSDADKEGIR